MIDFPLRNSMDHLINNVENGEEVYIHTKDGVEFLGLLKTRADGRNMFIRPNLKDRVHLFRKDQSYALDTTLTKELSLIDAVLFFETDSGKYYTTADYMLEKGTVRQFGRYNEQVFLKRELFTRSMPSN